MKRRQIRGRFPKGMFPKPSGVRSAGQPHQPVLMSGSHHGWVRQAACSLITADRLLPGKPVGFRAPGPAGQGAPRKMGHLMLSCLVPGHPNFPHPPPEVTPVRLGPVGCPCRAWPASQVCSCDLFLASQPSLIKGQSTKESSKISSSGQSVCLGHTSVLLSPLPKGLWDR